MLRSTQPVAYGEDNRTMGLSRDIALLAESDHLPTRAHADDRSASTTCDLPQRPNAERISIPLAFQPNVLAQERQCAAHVRFLSCARIQERASDPQGSPNVRANERVD